MVLVGDVRCTLYLIGDVLYPICIYLVKNCKAANDLQKKKFDNSMNYRRVLIKKSIGSLKERWKT